jgi:hypothetical protein
MSESIKFARNKLHNLGGRMEAGRFASSNGLGQKMMLEKRKAVRKLVMDWVDG